MKRRLGNACAVLAWSALAVCGGAQTTWYVDDDATPPGAGTQASPYASIQFAIERPTTVSGDTILVLRGTYAEAIDLGTKELSVQSTQGHAVTVVDAPDPVGGATTPTVRYAGGQTEASLLQGFTITGGTGDAASMAGGGMFLSGASPRIVDCRIVLNTAADSGGGVHAVGSTTTFADCRIEGNDVPTRGAGVNASSSALTFVDCRIEHNGGPLGDKSEWVFEGGGIAVESGSLWLVGCEVDGNAATNGGGVWARDSDVIFDVSTIAGNVSAWGGSGASVRGGSLSITASSFTDNDGFGDGGGLSLRGCDSASVVSSAFVGNSVFVAGFTDGGGLHVSSSNLIVEDTLFEGNSAGRGGGVYALSGGEVRLVRCVFRENRASNDECKGSGFGGALFVPSFAAADTHVSFSLFVGNEASDAGCNQGLGMGGAVEGPARLTSCTLVENRADRGGGGGLDATFRDSILWANVPDQLAGSSQAAFSDVQGGWPGLGNIDADPLFVDAAGGDWHLTTFSPCVDAGDPLSDPDPCGGPADMGAFPMVDCNRNGSLDCDDIALGTSEDVNGNGRPDECECLSESYCATTPNSVGPGAVMGISGSVSVSLDDLVLRAESCPPGKPGVFFYGAGRTGAPLGDGVRCVGGSLWRLPLRTADPSGVASFAMDYQDPPQPSGQITPGLTRHFQFWYRDPSGPGGTGSNVTDAITLTFCP